MISRPESGAASVGEAGSSTPRPGRAPPESRDAPGTVDEARLRHGSERAVFVATLLLNIALVAGAVALLRFGEAWLDRYPRFATLAKSLEAAATALIIAPLALTLARNQRRTALQANGVHLAGTQFTAIHDEYAEMCARLGLRNPPELYIAEERIETPSTADSTWTTQFIVLNARYVDEEPEAGRAVYRFLLARELGRVRLGHTNWLNELLVAYVIRIPLLRNPLLHSRTYSHDRYAAALAPDSLRGLLVQATGRHLLPDTDVDGLVQQLRAVRGWRPRMLQLTESSPYLAFRIQALDRAELTMTDVAGSARPPALNP